MQSFHPVGTVEVTLFTWSVHRSPDRRLQAVGLHRKGLKKADWKLSEVFTSATFIPTGGTASTIVTSTSHPHSSIFFGSWGGAGLLVCLSAQQTCKQGSTDRWE